MQQINLNLVPSGVPPVVYASQYDIGRTFRINLFDGNDAYTVPDGAVITLIGTKTDMHSFAYSSEDDDPKVKVDGSSITVTTTEQMCAMPGVALCEISVRKSTTLIIGSLNFILQVEKAIVPEDGFLNASDLNAFEEMSSKVQGSYEYFKETKEHVDQVKSDVADMQADVHAYVDAFTESVNHIVSVTLEASKWIGDNPPYKYDLSAITNFSNVIATVSMDPNVYTEDQMRAALDANIKGAEHDSYLYAMDTKPTIDIPVIIGWQEYKKKEG